MIIYKLTNKVNNKVYIGQTRSSIKKRFSQHCETRNKTAIGLAIKKYGVDNFEYAILYENIETLEELNKKEIECISLYNSICPNGYNIEYGGKVIFANAESKSKISKALKGRKITWSKKISESVKKLWENEEYRNSQIKQRHEKRGKYRKGIIKEKLKKKINKEELKKDYESFISLKEISDKHKISTEYLYRFIKREGIPKRGYKCNKTKD
jgi:group I intron endonuclease